MAVQEHLRKVYSEGDILCRTLLGHSGHAVVHKTYSGISVAMKTLFLEEELYEQFVKEVFVHSLP